MSRINFTLQSEIHSYCLCSCPWLCTAQGELWQHGTLTGAVLPWKNTIIWDVKQESSTYKWLICHIETRLINIPDPKSITWHIRMREKPAKQPGGTGWYWSSRRNEVQRERLPASGFEDYVFVAPSGRGRSRCYCVVEVYSSQDTCKASNTGKKNSHCHPSLHYLHY